MLDEDEQAAALSDEKEAYVGSQVFQKPNIGLYTEN
jgi:hypothetical protein